MKVLQVRVNIRPTLFRALENHAKIAAKVTAAKQTPAASSIPIKSIFLNNEFPVTTSVVTVTAKTICNKTFLTVKSPKFAFW